MKMLSKTGLFLRHWAHTPQQMTMVEDVHVLNLGRVQECEQGMLFGEAGGRVRRVRAAADGSASATPRHTAVQKNARWRDKYLDRKINGPGLFCLTR